MLCSRPTVDTRVSDVIVLLEAYIYSLIYPQIDRSLVTGVWSIGILFDCIVVANTCIFIFIVWFVSIIHCVYKNRPNSIVQDTFPEHHMSRFSVNLLSWLHTQLQTRECRCRGTRESLQWLLFLILCTNLEWLAINVRMMTKHRITCFTVGLYWRWILQWTKEPGGGKSPVK